ncbi:DUF5957 family protein [Kroppenstedtia eburnea]|nr:DUF5957 family protein [Kroppenstedtia eburnea]
MGIVRMALFHQPVGIKFLPYICSAVCAVLVPIWDRS